MVLILIQWNFSKRSKTTISTMVHFTTKFSLEIKLELKHLRETSKTISAGGPFLLSRQPSKNLYYVQTNFTFACSHCAARLLLRQGGPYQLPRSRLRARERLFHRLGAFHQGPGRLRIQRCQVPHPGLLWLRRHRSLQEDPDQRRP